MAYTIYVNGNGYPYPETGDTAWGNNATEFAKAVGTALSLIGLGQTVNVNGSIVKIDSTTQGIYIPRVATGSLPAGTKDKSLLLYNSTNDRFEYWNGSSWAPIAENASGDLTVARDLTVTRNLTVDTDVLKTDATNNRVGINTASPTVALDITGDIKASSTIQSANGTATAPGITFSGDTNTGIYNIAADTIGFSANGAERARIDSQGIELIDGTAAAPSISFSSDTNTGLYRIGADVIGVATNGTRVGQIGVGYGGFTGNIIQVQNTTLTSAVSISVNSNTFVDISGLSVNITPKYTSSKILILSQVSHVMSSSYIFEGFRIVRDSTPIIVGDTAGSRQRATGGLFISSTSSDQFATSFFSGIDSPNTTNQITYKLQAMQSASGGSALIYINRNTSDIDNAFNIRTTSSIIVMEIQQ